jgi:hypothetical protein
MARLNQICMAPGCTERALVRCPGARLEYLCVEHVTEVGNSLEAIAAAEADEAETELDDFRDKGGKVS